MGSTRLPGKVLECIAGEPLILRALRELMYVANVSVLQVVTSNSPKDDLLCGVLTDAEIDYFRGDELDVLDRYLCAAKRLNLDAIVRVNGDCPFIDPLLVQDVVNHYISRSDNIDYVSTVIDETFPLGMHVEVFSFGVLAACSKEATGFEREHVTPFIYNNPNRFRIDSFKSEQNFANYRLTVDYPEDLTFSRKLADLLDLDAKFGEPRNRLLSIIRILEENDDLVAINSSYRKPQTMRSE